MDILSKKLPSVTASVVVAVFAVAPALAQSAQDRRPEVLIVGHGTLVGAQVIETAKSDDKDELGKIADLVLDGRSGKVRYAVLSSGGAQGAAVKRTVPWGWLSWDGAKTRFTTSKDAGALAKLPEFDPKNLDRMRGGSAVDAEGGQSGRSGDATGSKRQGKAAKGGGRDRRQAASYVLATKIGDCEVVAQSEPLGAGDTVFIEPASGSIAFLSVAARRGKGTDQAGLLVPWKALKLVQPRGDAKMRIRIEKSREQLAEAPKTGSQNTDVNKPEFRAKVYRAYGVERPAFEPKQDRRD